MRWSHDAWLQVARLPPGYADVTISDPPFLARDGESILARARSGSAEGHHGSNEARRRSAELVGVMTEPQARILARELLRVTKRWIVLFTTAESIGLWERAFGSTYVRSGVWVKTNGCPQRSGDRPAQGCEFLVIAHRHHVRKRWNGGGKSAVYCGPRPYRPMHPCQKPGWLARELVEDFSYPGELVLDPFAGSGVFVIAAYSMGRKVCWAERSEVYRERIADDLRLPLFQQRALPSLLVNP